MTILCAVDFSQASQGAADVAAAMAARGKEKVLLLHAVEPVVQVAPPEAGIVVDDLVSAHRRMSNMALQEWAGRLRKTGVEVEAVLEDGNPARVIHARAAAADVRLIVLASHGRGAAERFLLGSVADRVVHGAQRPVLLVGDNAAQLRQVIAEGKTLSVVVGVDLGRATDAALAWLRDLRASMDADVTLVHAYWPPGEASRLGLHGGADLYESDPEVVAILERELRTKVGTLPGKGLVAWRVIPNLGRPAERIMECAKDAHADVVLVGTSAPQGLARVFPGSSAMHVLHGWRGSALCVPAVYTAGRNGSLLPDYRVILAATDFSPAGNQAAMAAVALARVRGGVVHLLHVVPGSADAAWSMERRVGHPETHPHEVARLRALVPAEVSQVPVHPLVVQAPEPAPAIMQAAERLGADLVVVGNHSKGPMADAIIGSSAQRVLAQCRRPVMMVRE